MEQINKKQRFGLCAAGIGALVSGIALVTNTLDAVQVVASTILVWGGFILYVLGGRDSRNNTQ